jgi:hypothetical protein
MAIPNAVPPTPYAMPNKNVFLMAAAGASRKTVSICGIVIQATITGSSNQHTNAWASQ